MADGGQRSDQLSSPASADDDEEGDGDEENAIDCSPCCEQNQCRRTIANLLLGQVLSLCLCGTGISSQLLNEHFRVNTPAAQSFATYFFLCFVYGTALSCRDSDSGLVVVFRTRGWKYFLVALLDVQANYIIVYAYQYTNLTSVQLLDCFTIPVVLVLSWLCLSVRYLMGHVIGVAICLVGVGALIWADMLAGRGTPGGSNRLLGDLLCLAGATLYGVSNVCEEHFVKTQDRVEFLGMIGLFGSFISGIQLALLERDELAAVKWAEHRIALLYLLFAGSMLVFYSLVAIVIARTSATFYNLSILTADFYTMISGLLLFHYKFHLLYMFGFLAVMIGTIVYSFWKTQSTDSIPLCRRLWDSRCCCRRRARAEHEDESAGGVVEQTSQYGVLPLDSPLEGLRVDSLPASACPLHGSRQQQLRALLHDELVT